MNRQRHANSGNPLSPETLKVIAFDCDGVLFDSKEANIQFYNHVLERFARNPVRPEQHEYIHMHTVHESLLFLLGPGDDLQKALTYCQGLDFQIFHDLLECEPGLTQLLAFAKKSYHVALATNRMVTARDILAHFHLEQYFDLVVSASDVRFPKPHPESMEKIMTTFSASPQEILYVGDSAVDEALATATGVFFVAYKNPALEAHVHIDHFNELQALLSSASHQPANEPEQSGCREPTASGTLLPRIT